MADNIEEYIITAAHEANKHLGDALNKENKHILGVGDSVLETYEKAELSLIDPLTKVNNFRALEEWLKNDEQRQFALSKIPFERRKTGDLYPSFGILVFLDADGLGNANAISHDFGDKLLLAISGGVKKALRRPHDMIFRRGDKSDEFVVALPGTTERDYEVIEKKIQEGIREVRMEKSFNASLVFGTYGNGITAGETLKMLDNRLSQAKAGRPKGHHVETIFIKKHE